MLRKKTELSQEQLEQIAPTLIITRGERGSTIITGSERLDVPAVAPGHIAGPTGVGDAYRMASLAATYCLEEHGTQNHSYTFDQFLARYARTFGVAPELESTLVRS